MIMTKDFTHEMYAKAFIGDAQRAVTTLATELELLVKDLRAYADTLPGTVAVDSRTTPTSGASAIVGLYLNRVGNGGVRLSDLVYSAGKAEAHRAQIPHTDTKDGSHVHCP